MSKAEVYGCTNAAIDRMSKAARLDRFVGNKFGRAKHTRRVQAREGLNQPARLSAGSMKKAF